MPTVFNTVEQARKELGALGFRKTVEGQKKQQKKAQPDDDPNLELCARMLVFLDSDRFETALRSVSMALWAYYAQLPVATKNKFSRSLAFMATQNGFNVSTRPAQAPHPDTLTQQDPGPLDIKLVASYSDFFGLLRGRMFWKDSMDMQHGEYTHALQWLALRFEFGQQAAALYAELPDYWSSATRNRAAIPLWSYLADTFPEGFGAADELTSNTYRTPQMITRHLIGRAEPLRDHFLSHYLTYVYRQRNLVSYDKTKDYGVKTNYKSASGYAMNSPRLKNWTTVTEPGKDKVSKQVTRLDRNPQAVAAPATKQIGVPVTFHGIAGTLWTLGDMSNLTLNQAPDLEE